MSERRAMAEIYYDDRADLGILQDRHVAVLGYGSQGHAHALSLRDSGVDVRVGLPAGSGSRDRAASEGLRVVTPAEACEEADLIMVLVPDHLQRALYAEAGYQPEVAYFECLHEMKLIVDLMYEGGLSQMYWSVSDTAEYGGYTRGQRLIDERSKQEMRRILAEIRGGSFARELVEEFDGG